MKTEFLNCFSFSVLHSRTLRHSRDDKRQKQRLLFCRDATLYSDLMHQHVILKCKGWWRSLLLTPPTPDQHLSHLHLWRKVIQLRRVSSLFVSGNLMCFYKLKLSEVEQKLNFKLLCEHIVQPFSRSAGDEGRLSELRLKETLCLCRRTGFKARCRTLWSDSAWMDWWSRHLRADGSMWQRAGSEHGECLLDLKYFSLQQLRSASVLMWTAVIQPRGGSVWEQTSVWFWFWFWSVSDVCPGDTGTLLSGGVTNIFLLSVKI